MKNSKLFKNIFIILFFSTACFLYAESTAYQVSTESATKDSFDESVSFIKKSLDTLTVPAEKRSLLTFLGRLYEKQGSYKDALNCYVKAAAIAAGDAPKMPKITTEQLVLDAVRCALSTGDTATANDFLNSNVRNSDNPDIRAYIKLYSQWSLLINAKTLEDTKEPVVVLDAYTTLDSMKQVRPSLYLTLWYVTGEKKYAMALEKEYSGSPESLIVQGKIKMYPAAFWYFLPHSTALQQELPEGVTTEVADISSNTTADQKKSDKTPEKMKKQQLGLFREKANADQMVKTLKDKGFNAYITSELRPSGITYYDVVVDENEDESMGDKLRTAGFECYPLF